MHQQQHEMQLMNTTGASNAISHSQSNSSIPSHPNFGFKEEASFLALKLKRITRVNDALKQQLKKEDIYVSNVSLSLIDYYRTTTDYFLVNTEQRISTKIPHPYLNLQTALGDQKNKQNSDTGCGGMFCAS